jgi:hypothetical protein
MTFPCPIVSRAVMYNVFYSSRLAGRGFFGN